MIKILRCLQRNIGKMVCMISGLAAMTILSGCVHEFPEPEDTAPVCLTIVHELSWSEYDYVYTRSSASGNNDWTVRYVIHAYKQGCTDSPAYVFTRYSNDIDLDPFTTAIELPVGEWDLYFWSDFICSENAFYSVADFAGITYTEPYMGDTDRRDAFEGSLKSVKVDKSYEAGYHIEGTVTLKRPMAKYVFIATDFQKFYEETLRPAYDRATGNTTTSDVSDITYKEEMLTGYSVTAYYPLFMPDVYDMFQHKVMASSRGMSYKAIIRPIDDNEAQIAMDYVMMNDRATSAQVQIVMHTPGGQDIVITPTISVPLKRGQVTYVRGDFLTTDIGGGLDIDFSFSGDINIKV